VKEIVSSCGACLALRTDPPERFHWPEGAVPDGSVCYWFGPCAVCAGPSKFVMLGTRVEVASREEER